MTRTSLQTINHTDKMKHYNYPIDGNPTARLGTIPKNAQIIQIK
jgi:hypothetical protein